MDIAIILDVAHGKDTLGKRSPDGKFREYKWSREIAQKIIDSFKGSELPFALICPYLNDEYEPGISVRRKRYEKIALRYDRTVMISLHVDAYGKGERWYNDITGISFWTSKGETSADAIATFIGTSFFNKYMRDEKFRFAYWLSEKETKSDLDWEANFGVINSNKYDGVLVEHNFQTNKNDVYNKLLNEEWNEILVNLYNSTIIDLVQQIRTKKL